MTIISTPGPRALIAAALLFGHQPPQHAVPPNPQGADQSRGVLDPVETYNGMGLIAAGEPLPFVAGVYFLSGTDPDSTLVLFGLSLANRALSFRRVGTSFEARYVVTVTFRDGEVVRAHFPAAEVVRVASYGETVRGDESVIFQKYFSLAPGGLVADVAVVDEYGADTSRAGLKIEVPSFRSRHMLSSIVPVYQADPRRSLDVPPGMVVNARASIPYAQDSLLLYFEGYGLPEGTIAELQATGEDGTAVWAHSVVLRPQSRLLSTALVAVPSDMLAVGVKQIEVRAGNLSAVRLPALIALADERPVASFEDLVSLLRYFDDADWLAALREAAVEDQPDTWRGFWDETDSDPETANNETLDRYFMRVDEANVRFHEPGTPGWMTERGEVFVTLGIPDDVRDLQPDRSPTEHRLVRWRYFEDGLTIYFVDEENVGRLRLTPASRADYEAVAARKRRKPGG